MNDPVCLLMMFTQIELQNKYPNVHPPLRELAIACEVGAEQAYWKPFPIGRQILLVAAEAIAAVFAKNTKR